MRGVVIIGDTPSITEELLAGSCEIVGLADVNIKTSENMLLQDVQVVRVLSDDEKNNNFLVNNALKYMKQHYRENLHLQDVAEQVYISQWYLSKLLKHHTKQSFLENLNWIRIEEAKRLLQNSSLKIGDISEMVGFLSLPHFSRVFKQQTGMSAREYRNNLSETKNQ